LPAPATHVTIDAKENASVTGPTLPSLSTRALVQACVRMGLDRDELLAAAGVHASVLDNPDAQVPWQQLGALWREAYAQSQDPDLALHAVEQLPFGAYKVIDFMGGCAPTVGEALARVCRYFPLINDHLQLTILKTDSGRTIELRTASGDTEMPRSYAEYTVAALVFRTRGAAGSPWAPDSVDFAFPKPDSDAEHRRLLACPIRFGAAPTAIHLSQATWDRPTGQPDPMLLESLEAHANSMLDKLNEEPPVVLAVRRALVDALHGGQCDLHAVARKTGTSERTLQRRLAKAGVSFGDLLEQTRRALAERYLRDRDVAIGEVSYLLGYSEQSAFSRAFRRWTGVSPAAFRREQALGGV